MWRISRFGTSTVSISDLIVYNTVIISFSLLISQSQGKPGTLLLWLHVSIFNRSETFHSDERHSWHQKFLRFPITFVFRMLKLSWAYADENNVTLRQVLTLITEPVLRKVSRGTWNYDTLQIFPTKLFSVFQRIRMNPSLFIKPQHFTPRCCVRT